MLLNVSVAHSKQQPEAPPIYKQWIMIVVCHTQCCRVWKQESPANAKGTRDSTACMKAHCEQM